MAFNPNYDEIGKTFVSQYYSIFDNPDTRAQLVVFYNPTTSFMTFEGCQVQGAEKIIEKFQALGFRKVNRIITAIDNQPMADGGIFISVLGRLQCDEDPAHAFGQVFVLQPQGQSFFCAHDIFRLNIHNTA